MVRSFISSGAPLPNKTGHSGRHRAATHHKLFQNVPPPVDADFSVIDLDLVNDRTQVSAAERDRSVGDVLLHESREGGDRLFRDPRIGTLLLQYTVKGRLGLVPLVTEGCKALLQGRVRSIGDPVFDGSIDPPQAGFAFAELVLQS